MLTRSPRGLTKQILLMASLIGLTSSALASSTAASRPGQNDPLADVRAYLKISDQLSTSGQITTEDIASIKNAGFDVVVNLAPARKERNYEEGFRVTEAGMTYVQIPVDWQNPAARDLEMFFDVMDANTDRNVYVHCFANMRVSVFVYLYRTMKLGVDKTAAMADLHKIWDPSERDEWAQWVAFIEAAEK